MTVRELPPHFRVVLSSPATPAERAAGWQRFVELVEWLIAQGAIDDDDDASGRTR